MDTYETAFDLLLDLACELMEEGAEHHRERAFEEMLDSRYKAMFGWTLEDSTYCFVDEIIYHERAMDLDLVNRALDLIGVSKPPEIYPIKLN